MKVITCDFCGKEISSGDSRIDGGKVIFISNNKQCSWKDNMDGCNNCLEKIRSLVLSEHIGKEIENTEK